MNEQVLVLGGAFIGFLARSMTAEQYDEFLKKTREQYDVDVCHSHDYVDANEVMMEAFEWAFGRPPQIEDDADMELMNAAWSKAKSFIAGRD